MRYPYSAANAFRTSIEAHICPVAFVYRALVRELSPLVGRTRFLRVQNKKPAIACGSRKFSGAGDGTRTRNLLITNQLLYRLSYASTFQTVTIA